MRNRTQEEVAAREPLSRVRAREAQFFSQLSELSSLVGSGILGMQALEIAKGTKPKVQALKKSDKVPGMLVRPCDAAAQPRTTPQPYAT